MGRAFVAHLNRPQQVHDEPPIPQWGVIGENELTAP